MGSAGERKRFCCGVCAKPFPHVGKLTVHMRRHTGEKPFECAACGRSFAQRSTRSRHALAVHADDEGRRRRRPYAWCPETTATAGRRSRRGRTAAAAATGPYACATCRKTFGERCHLARHARTHTGERPFGCAACGKTFARNDALTAHLRVHTGERPYGCAACGRAFAAKGALTAHLRVHTGERPYECDVCGRAFGAAATLAAHMRVHYARPYECGVCAKKFAAVDQLITHGLRHADGAGRRPDGSLSGRRRRQTRQTR